MKKELFNTNKSLLKKVFMYLTSKMLVFNFLLSDLKQKLLFSSALLIALSISLPFITTSCGKDSVGGGSGSEEAIYTIYSNISDPLFLSARTEVGDSLAIFGKRNELGVPTSFSSAVVRLVNKTINTEDDQFRIQDEFFYIENKGLSGLPSQIAQEDYTFLFEWESSTNVVVTAVDNFEGGRTQMAFNINEGKSQPAMVPVSVENIIPRTSASHPGFNPDRIIDLSGKSSQSYFNTFKSSSSTSTITVDYCDLRLNDAQAQINLAQPGNMNLWVAANPVGNGQYVAQLPILDDTVGEEVEQLCIDVLGPLGVACSGAKELLASSPLLCSKIAVASGPAAPKVLAACFKGIAAYAYYCSFAHFDIQNLEGYDGPNPVDYVCGGIGYVIDRGIDYFGEPITYTVQLAHPSLRSIDDRHHPDVATSPAAGPYPNINISIDGYEEIIGFWASPGNPPPGVGYMVYASLGCLEIGTEIGLSLVGTDGYTDSTTCIAEYPNHGCMLSVPGAEGGVVDVITLTINGIEVDQLTVVFGSGSTTKDFTNRTELKQ